MARNVSTSEALMTDPTTPEGAAYWQERHDYEKRLERIWEGHSIVALSTLQIAAPGRAYTLLGPAQASYDMHLVRVAEPSGTPGPTLCGIDRFAKGTPGWSVGGGVSGPSVKLVPCRACVEAAVTDYPDLPLHGSVGRREFLDVMGAY